MALNKVIIHGNISTEVELKQTNNGTSVCSFNVAVNRYSKDPTEAKADFFTVVAWSAKAEFVSRYFSKGKPILVCGRLENRAWTDKSGNKRVATEIIAEEVSFVGGAAENTTEAKNTAPVQAYIPTAYGGNNSARFEEIPNGEDLPF